MGVGECLIDGFCFYNGVFRVPRLYTAHHHSGVIGSAESVDGEVAGRDVVSCVQSLIVLVARPHCGRSMLKNFCFAMCWWHTAPRPDCAMRRLVILMTSVKAKQWLEYHEKDKCFCGRQDINLHFAIFLCLSPMSSLGATYLGTSWKP